MADAVTPETLASYPGNPTDGLMPDQIALTIRLTNGLIEEITGPLATIPARVETIALEVAARALRNPEGASEEKVDDYSVKRPRGQDAAGVYLTGWEQVRVAAAVAAIASERPVYVVSLGGE